MPIASHDLAALSRLLDQAMEIAPADVEPWLAALPAEQAHLAAQVRRVLAAQGESTHFMTGSADVAGADASVAHAGDRVGAYRLIREIGQGGMGTVWLAERVDGSLKRNVALKLPRLAWGAGLAERMARERDIGALLEHPNIARLYDAGVDERGRPFLALEYVDGVPLDQWCKEKALAIPERLRLFAQIAGAVSYAHGRLVVHRDLKPSNVLVSADGQAHLLDFGIAKLLDDSSPASDLTREQGRVLTPHYASPEQIRGETITVASDVYSLGVLLYELLTGTLPYGHVRGKSLGALEQAILEGEVELPSSRVRDRPTSQTLHGELDAIVGKALRRESGERYATADALVQDIERHLKGERVLAQPESIRYRIQRGLRRHRAAFVAGCAVFVAIVGGAGVSLVQAKHANDAAERARVVKEFVVDVFRVNERGSAGNKELRSLPAELLLDRGAKLIETKFPGQPELQAELYGVVGGIFADMGANAQAADYATRQVETLVAIDASHAEQAKATLLLAQALLAEKRIADARIRAERALALAERYDDLRPTALVLLAEVKYKQGDKPGSRELLDRAERDLGPSPKATVAGARAKAVRASLLGLDNRFDEATALYRSGIDTALEAEGPLSPTAIWIRLVLQWLLVNNDRGEEAIPYREAALSALRATGAAGEIRAALVESETVAHMFAGMVPRQISFDDARDAIERNRAVVAAHALVPASIVAELDRALSRIYLERGEVALAAPLSDRSYAVLAANAESLGERWVLAVTQGAMAMFLGRHDRAAAYQAEAIDLRKQRGEGEHPYTAYDYSMAALNLEMQGRYDDAEKVLMSAPRFEALRGGGVTSSGYEDVIPKAMSTLKLNRGDAAGALTLLPPEEKDQASTFPSDDVALRGEILCAIGRGTEGLVRLEKSIRFQEELVSPRHPGLARTKAVTGLCALLAGQRARAETLAAEARQAFIEQPDVSPYFKAPLDKLEQRLRPRVRS